MNMDNLVLAFTLTFLAGISTGIGSLLAFVARRTNTRYLSFALGFSAGVMVYVSFVEIFAKARDSLSEIKGERAATWITVAAFFGGIAVIALIDRLVPNAENPHEMHKLEEMEMSPEQVHQNKTRRLMRMGLMAAVAIGIHNFPEGMVTFVAVLGDPGLGISIAVAIAIHNIPEGIAVSVPIYHATGSRKKAFVYSFLSGLAEPAGALLGYIFLIRWMGPEVFGILFAAVAGVMVYISFDELLPAAEEYGEHHFTIAGLLAGMAVMALSLLLFM